MAAEDTSKNVSGTDLVARVQRCLHRLRAQDGSRIGGRAKVVVGLFGCQERIEVRREEGPCRDSLVVAGVAARAEVDEIWEAVEAREGEEVRCPQVRELGGF